MGQTTKTKQTTKQQAQAERQEEGERETVVAAYALGYANGLSVREEKNYAAGYSAGRLDETQLCEFLLDHARYLGREGERLRWTNRPFFQRLRYLINPNYVR